MEGITASIRFPQGRFRELRERVLQDLTHETFAVLFAKREEVGGHVLFKVMSLRFWDDADYEARGRAYLRPRREAVHRILAEMRRRFDVDTLIDVHTHPFCRQGVAFSGVDDADEARFARWLANTFDGLHYASVVLSQSDYSARCWRVSDGKACSETAIVKTQTALENWPSADLPTMLEANLAQAVDPETGFLARSALALGLEVLRKMMHRQSIAVIGVGGLGSAIAENLVHMGFMDLHLIDPDRVEPTNLNRIVGAYHQDAIAERLKVDVVQDHLRRINPAALVTGHPCGIEDPEALPVLAAVDWIIVATDNQSSRFKAQQIALGYFVPLISAGVGISVEEGRISDMSGEVITVRAGDGLCLHCLGRINPTQVAAEQAAGGVISQELIKRGYVRGQTVKEPAVKTLNAMLAAMAVEVLLNQYTDRQAHAPIQVYENNRGMAIYPDTTSLEARKKCCFSCGVYEA
jgi:molybdopterin/thiamine biosynthesis adenylyltransferase